MNYERIINYIKQVCLNHPLVNGVGYGEISDVVSNDTGVNNFPYVFINPGTIQNTTNNANLNVNLICITQTFNNELDIVRWQSTCYQILNDVIAYINQDDTYDPLLDLTNNWTINVFKERFKDDVVGATANITFTYYSPLDNCDTEFTPTYPPVTVIDGDDSVHIIPAGGSYECLPATPKSGVFYQRVIPWDGYDHSSIEGSVEWHRKQGTYDYTPPSNPLRIALLSDTYVGSDAGCLLKQTNIFNNNFRFTNDIGQQYVEDFNQSASNNSSNKQLCLDHLTGLMIYVWNYTGQNPLNLNWTASIDYANNFTYGGHSDWRMASLNEYIALFSNYITANAWDTMYAPWVDPNIRSFGGSFWLGSADVADAGLAHTFVTNGATIGEISLVSTRSYPFMVRNFHK
jgi:hypothetical protein